MCIRFHQHCFVKICGVLAGGGLEERGPGAGVGSPRRKEILNDILGLRVRVVASTFEEDLDKSSTRRSNMVRC
jgi:hypothetical protein